MKSSPEDRPSSTRASRGRRAWGVEMLEGRSLLTVVWVSRIPIETPRSRGEVPPSFLLTPIPDDATLAEHIHPHLTILVDGQRQTIPADIGISLGQYGALPLHTHDTSGTIHVETTVPYIFRLKDFFTVWGQTFNRHDILGHTTGNGHKITMTVDGRPSQAFGNVVLRDHEQIVIKYT